MTGNWSLAGQGWSSTMVSEEARRHEVYCLTMRVTCNVGPMAASKDLEVPPHAWWEGIARDITEHHLGIPPGVITVKLLNNTEFMVLDQSKQYIRQMHGVTHWVSTEVHISARQDTINKSWKGLANTQEYWHQHAMEWMSNAQNWLQALAAEEAMKRLLKQPKSCRWDYTCWADQYYVQEYLKQWDTPLMLAHPKSLGADQFESTKEDSDNESTSTDTDTEGSGETGTSTGTETTTTANRQWKRNKAKHQEWCKN